MARDPLELDPIQSKQAIEELADWLVPGRREMGMSTAYAMNLAGIRVIRVEDIEDVSVKEGPEVNTNQLRMFQY
jgi:hypothetical protein